MANRIADIIPPQTEREKHLAIAFANALETFGGDLTPVRTLEIYTWVLKNTTVDVMTH